VDTYEKRGLVSSVETQRDERYVLYCQLPFITNRHHTHNKNGKKKIEKRRRHSGLVHWARSGQFFFFSTATT
jgi:hypothetical protein